VSDPLCGIAFTNELTRDIFVGFVQMRGPALEARIPKTLPVLVILRRSTPWGETSSARAAWWRAVRRWGRIERCYHTGARHELVNEINRDEVMADVLGWLGKTA